ncbi:hypothetical protein BLAT2472_110021 [Burkholderia latens]
MVMQLTGALQNPRIGKALLFAFQRPSHLVQEATHVLRRKIGIAAEAQRQGYCSEIGFFRVSRLFFDDAFQLPSRGIFAFADCRCCTCSNLIDKFSEPRDRSRCNTRSTRDR